MIRIVATDYGALPTFQAVVKDGKGTAKPIKGELSDLGYVEFPIPGDATLQIRWNGRERLLGGTPVGRSGGKRKPAIRRTKKAKR